MLFYKLFARLFYLYLILDFASVMVDYKGTLFHLRLLVILI
jgi:hypothetical protein